MTAAKRGRTERLQIIVNTDELAVIDDFRFKSRMPSRAAAVRELLRRGLASGPRKGGPPRSTKLDCRGADQPSGSVRSHSTTIIKPRTVT
jgi:hypothetical protein